MVKLSQFKHVNVWKRSIVFLQLIYAMNSVSELESLYDMYIYQTY